MEKAAVYTGKVAKLTVLTNELMVKLGGKTVQREVKRCRTVEWSAILQVGLG
jgi:hypothetical protein